MSINLSLVEFHQGADGKLFERNYQLVDSVFLGADLREEFRQHGFFKQLDLYENADSKDSTNIEVVDESQVTRLLERLEQKFRQLFAVGQENEKTNIVIQEEIDAQISEFRKITNLYYLVKLKLQQFNGLENCFLKLG